MLPDDLFQKAFLLHQSGQFERAASLYEQLLREQPRNADILHLLSILYGQQNKLKEAKRYIKKALALRPTAPTFHNTRGNIERRLGHKAQAMSHYQQALTLDPASASANNNLGVLYDEQGDLEQAVHYYSTALRLKPDYADAARNLGNVFIKQEKFEKAIDALKKALTLEPDDAAIHHQLAVALTHEDQYDEAVLHYRETLTRDPHHVEALQNLGALYLIKRELDLALTCYLRLLLLKPEIDTYYNLGLIYFYQDKHQDAINYFSEVLALEPNHLNTHLNLGACYLKMEAREKAILHYQTALSLKPNDPEIIYIISALTQENLPDTTPAPYIENLFDQYAPYFDQHLTKYLQYDVPALLRNAVINYMGLEQAEWDILDLGCGTGLCGQQFRAFAGKMIGVDLSSKMLEAAGEKHLYDVLEKLDIHDAVEKYAPLDLIIAGDVLGYVGDLDRLFALIKNALRSHGLFVFTVEKRYEEGYGLHSHARFAHHRLYIEMLAEKYGLQVVCEENAVLRMQKAEQVMGYVFLLSAWKE